ncbi:MAG: RNA polymerase sigma-70 factor [Steroidobacteraceae bacterium]
MSDYAAIFEQHRAKLRGVAYRMLGSRSDAEDVVQDAYLRWHRTSVEEIRSAEAWLVTAVTRLAIDRLRQAKVERESYVGPWLPEPLVANQAPPADAASELASNLSVAFLVVLERLVPEERAAFLLHEVFDSGYHEIAQILGKSEAACRQIVSRASKRVHEARPRVQVTEAARTAVLDRFVQAIMSHDKEGMMQLLATDVAWVSDGGGKTHAALKPVLGNDAVARFVMGVIGSRVQQAVFRYVDVNGETGLALYFEGRLIAVISIRTDGARILEVFSILNPEKLSQIGVPFRLVSEVH